VQADATDMCCASCGKSEVDEIKLKECDDCDLVRYCSDACLKEHEPTHKEACVKRAAELRDELLFKQPESTHLGDCPICCLPLSLDTKKSTIMMCCSKMFCNGCGRTNAMREKEVGSDHRCPFCRKPALATAKEWATRRIERIQANDPVAMRQEGIVRHNKGDLAVHLSISRKLLNWEMPRLIAN